MGFKDHFSGHSSLYSRYRPDYPQTLYRFLAGCTPAHQLAWDCATGNGQAALALAEHYDRVIATDASAAQIEQAVAGRNIEYRVAPAEDSGLETASVDLVTVAQALHWFDLDAFYREVSRVLNPGGVLAAWSYNFLQCEAIIDALLNRYYSEIVGPFWPPERVHIEKGYRDLPFPFEEESAPKLFMQSNWSLDQLLGYLRTWSATQRYTQAHGTDPVLLIEKELTSIWGAPGTIHTIYWPLTLRWGRKP
jgi:SAM-dependent methyltransferase